MNKVAKTLLFLLLLICFGCEQKPPYRIPHYYENEEEIEIGEEYSSNPEHECWEEDEEWEDVEWSDYSIVVDYVPERLYVPAGVSFEQALYQSQPQLYYNSDIEGLGGAKLIAEMSADVAGISGSRDNWKDRIIKIQPMHILKIHIDTIPPCIVSRMIKKEVTLRSCVINSTPLIFDEHFEVNIFLTNNTDIPLNVIIRQGTMIESETENVQNIVVAKPCNVSLPPLQTSSISVLAYCAAHHRSDPSGRRGRITPYVLNAPSSVYNTQQAVWNYIEAPARNKMTFYAWGPGDSTGHGENSKMGHAFVWIKNSGYWGFGPQKGQYFGGGGSVFEHSRSRPFATDSCSVYVTDRQLRQAQQKLEQLKHSPPGYNLGIYDCTSFAMDIADAAGVYYGSRWHIQTPIYFMEQLKKYNR